MLFRDLLDNIMHAITLYSFGTYSLGIILKRFSLYSFQQSEINQYVDRQKYKSHGFFVSACSMSLFHVFFSSNLCVTHPSAITIIVGLTNISYCFFFPFKMLLISPCPARSSFLLLKYFWIIFHSGSRSSELSRSFYFWICFYFPVSLDW